MKLRTNINNRKFQFILFLYFTLFTYLYNTFGQIEEKQKPKEYISEAGWEIPGLEYCKKGKVIYKQNNKRVTSYLLKENLFVEPFFYILEDKRKINDDPEDSHIMRWRVREIIKYEACGIIYCYKVSYNPYSIPKSEGVGGAMGALYEILYYDDNGDGRFERLTDGFIPENPQWICKD
jgi:hypothetical protein